MQRSRRRGVVADARAELSLDVHRVVAVARRGRGAVDAAALAMAREPSQVVDILTYVIQGTLPGAQRAAAE